MVSAWSYVVLATVVAAACGIGAWRLARDPARARRPARARARNASAEIMRARARRGRGRR